MIEVAVSFPYDARRGLRELLGESLDLSAEEQATIDPLNAEYQKLEAEYEGADELPEEVDQRLGEIERALAAFEARPVRFEADDIARAGVFISIAHNGSLDIDRGYVRAEDEVPIVPEGETGVDTGGDPRPDAMDLVFQGRNLWNRGATAEQIAKARGFFQRALAIDPGNIEALVGVARADVASASLFLVDAADREARFAAAETILSKSLSMAPQHAWAHLCLGFVKLSTNRAAQGISDCERALALDRNLAEAHSSIGMAKALIGRSAETETHVQEALRLSPRDVGVHRWMHYVGVAKLLLSADAEAVVWLRRSIETKRSYPLVHFHLAAALAHLGSLNEARDAVQVGLAFDPAFTIRRMRGNIFSDNPIYFDGSRRIRDGMRMAEG